MFAFTFEGEPLWSKTWPPQPIYLDFGTASSPVVHDGKVWLLQDSERESFLTALDAATGTELWRAARPRGRSFPLQSSWSTPFVWTHGGRTEVVTTGHGMIASSGLDGTELWRIGNTTMPTPTPFSARGLLYVGTGAQGGDASRPFFAIRPGGSGDLTPGPDETSNEFVAWMQPRASGYTPSGIVYDGRAYLVHDTGIMGVYDAETGEELYKARVGGVGHTFSASPIAAAGRLYFPDEDGVMVVVQAGEKYTELAQNDLGEMMLASPAVTGNAMFIRTETKLYRIAGAGARH
jgi:outer membrane protein assembly factor BamB